MKELLILEAADGIAGPVCGLQLADLGARVVKVEPPEGDRTRGWGAADLDGESPVFLALNRSKDSILVDPGAPGSTETLRALVLQADVLIEHLRPLTPAWAERLGAEPGALNPRLVHVRISANGPVGPLAGAPGSELTAQALSGYWKMLGAPSAPPLRHGAEIAEIGTGLFAYQAVLAALIERRRSGRGQGVDLCLLGSLMAYATILTAAMNQPDDWIGFHLLNILWAPDDGFHTADGKVTLEFRRGRALWVEFCTRAGLGHLPDDPRFQDWRGTVYTGDRVGETKADYETALGTLPTASVLALAAEVGGTSVPHNTMARVSVHPQVESLGAFASVPLAGSGAVRQVASPFRVDLGGPAPAHRPAPRLGGDTTRILGEIPIAAD